MKAESNIGGLLGKSSRLLSHCFNSELLALGISVEQWSLIAVLWDKDHLSQKELQEALLKDKATINSLVNYLLKGEFITKIPSKKDKRSVVISLSLKGEALKSSTIPLAMKSIGIATDGIEKEELEIFVNVLNKIIINLTKAKK